MRTPPRTSRRRRSCRPSGCSTASIAARPFAPWLHRIVTNRALDWARAHALRRPVEADARAGRARCAQRSLRRPRRGDRPARARPARRRGPALPARAHAGRDRGDARPARAAPSTRACAARSTSSPGRWTRERRRAAAGGAAARVRGAGRGRGRRARPQAHARRLRRARARAPAPARAAAARGLARAGRAPDRADGGRGRRGEPSARATARRRGQRAVRAAGQIQSGVVLALGRGVAYTVTARGPRARARARARRRPLAARHERRARLRLGARRRARRRRAGALALRAPGPVSLPRWSRERTVPPCCRVAYLAGGALYVVGGDGKGARRVAAHALAVAPAWRPRASAHELAFAAPGGIRLARDRRRAPARGASAAQARDRAQLASGRPRAGRRSTPPASRSTAPAAAPRARRRCAAARCSTAALRRGQPPRGAAARRRAGA